jgi:hypothetical protein
MHIFQPLKNQKPKNLDMDMHKYSVNIHLQDMYIHIFKILTQGPDMYIYIFANYTY